MSLTAAEIAAMRETVEAESFPDTATLLAPTQTDDGQGGETTTWDPAGTFACIVLPASDPEEGRQAGRLVSGADWVIRLPHGTAVTRKHRLQVNGYTYEVLGIDSGLSFGTFLEVACRRLDA